MKNFWLRFVQVTIDPDAFFEEVREEKCWRKPALHLLVLSFLLGVFSVTAWGAGIPGNTPINASLTAQMDVYSYWNETLLPQFGALSYLIAAGLIMVEMILISAFYTPILFLFFRYLGREKAPYDLLRAFQGFVYNLTPVLFGGFLPWLALITGVYATILQLYRGPAITLKNRTVFAYMPVILVLAYAIAQYWQGGLL